MSILEYINTGVHWAFNVLSIVMIHYVHTRKRLQLHSQLEQQELIEILTSHRRHRTQGLACW
jgi:hypothetical protein